MKRLVALMLVVSMVFWGAVAPGPARAQTEDFATYASSGSLAEDHANLFRLYWAFFDREPDVGGAQYWVSQYDQCASLLDITWSFGNSTEFVNRYGSLDSGAYVDLVYRNVLGRLPDPEGRTYWVTLLETGQLIPAEVMLYFSLGQEFKNRRPLPSDGRAYGGCQELAPSNYYANCEAVRAAGADPLYRGEPGYRAGLDRDGDGVACER